MLSNDKNRSSINIVWLKLFSLSVDQILKNFNILAW